MTAAPQKAAEIADNLRSNPGHAALLVYSCEVQPNAAPLSTSGTYILFAAFVDPGAGTLLGNLSATIFEVDM